jgi:arginyl-tRNA synthetase
MDIYELLKNDIISNLTSIYKDLDFVSIKNLTVESPKNNQFGELSTNAAMVIAKVVKENPKDI